MLLSSNSSGGVKANSQQLATPQTASTVKNHQNGSALNAPNLSALESGAALALQKNNSSSVSSSIAEFIPMRSIIKAGGQAETRPAVAPP